MTHLYIRLFAFFFDFFVQISMATPQKHPCQAFVLVFGMTLEIKKIRKKNTFQFYQFPIKIIPVGLCLKALNSIKNLLRPFETNRIENYECFQVVGFEIWAKSAKIKKMYANDLRENENRPKNEA